MHLSSAVLPSTLTIGAMVPCTGWSVCQSAGAAIELAVSRVNNSTILKQYNITLDYKFRDDKCDPATSMLSTMQLYNAGADVLMGPGCSIGCEPASLLGQLWDMPLVSYSCVDPSLSNKLVYPNFVRVVEPGTKSPYVLASLAVKFSWQSVCIAASSETVFVQLLTLQNQIFKQFNISILATASFSPQPGNKIPVLQVLQPTGCRIIVVDSYAADFRDLLIAANTLGMVGPGWVYLGDDFGSSTWVDGYSPNDGLDSEARHLFSGAWMHNQGAGIGASFVQFTKDIQEATPAFAKHANVNITYPLDKNGQPVLTSTYALFLYDAVFYYAYLVADAIKHGLNPRSSTQLLSRAQYVKFTGVSGVVFVDSNGDRSGSQYTCNQFQSPAPLYNVNESDFTPVGLSADGVFNLFVDESELQWPYLSTTVPVAVVVKANVVAPDVPGVRASTDEDVLYAVFAVCILCSVAASTVIFINRKNRVITKYSPVMCTSSIVGLTLLFIGGVFLVGEDTVASCTLSAVFCHIGFTLTYASIALKTFRLSAIFHNPLLKHIPMSDLYLFARLSVLLVCDVVLLTTWFTVSPFSVQALPQATCVTNSATGNVCKYMLVVTKGVYMLYSCYLAFRVRDLPSAYNESHTLSIVVYACTAIGGIVLAMTYGLSLSTLSIETIWMIAIIITGLLTLFILFGAILYHIHSASRTSLNRHQARTVFGSRLSQNGTEVVQQHQQGQQQQQQRSLTGGGAVVGHLQYHDESQMNNALHQLDQLAAELDIDLGVLTGADAYDDREGIDENNVNHNNNNTTMTAMKLKGAVARPVRKVEGGGAGGRGAGAGAGEAGTAAGAGAGAGRGAVGGGRSSVEEIEVRGRSEVENNRESGSGDNENNNNNNNNNNSKLKLKSTPQTDVNVGGRLFTMSPLNKSVDKKVNNSSAVLPLPPVVSAPLNVEGVPSPPASPPNHSLPLPHSHHPLPPPPLPPTAPVPAPYADADADVEVEVDVDVVAADGYSSSSSSSSSGSSAAVGGAAASDIVLSSSASPMPFPIHSPSPPDNDNAELLPSSASAIVVAVAPPSSSSASSSSSSSASLPSDLAMKQFLFRRSIKRAHQAVRTFKEKQLAANDAIERAGEKYAEIVYLKKATKKGK